MKYLLIASVLLLTSCTEQTKFGKCVGIDGPRDQKLAYELNVTNLFLGIVFLETIIVPFIILKDETFCPTGVK